MQSKHLTLLPRNLKPSQLRQMVIQKHGKFWKQRNLASKSTFQRAAYDRATAAQTELNYDIEALISQIELVKARQAEVATRHGPLLLSTCRFESTDLQLFSVLLKSPDFVGARLEVLRERALTTPLPVRGDTCGEPTTGAPHPPQWCRGIACRRAAFVGTALVWLGPGGDCVVMRFLFAQQAPQIYMSVSLLR